jgi:ATP-dependent Clp protease adaptor protein ClpS
MARKIRGKAVGGRWLERPKRYQVVMLCDEGTSSGMMLRLLRAVFSKTADEALTVMLTAQRTGATAVAIYTQEVAETKANMAADFADRERQPVTLRVEPAE